MDNDNNNNIQNEITENERYTFCYTPDEYKEIFKLSTKKAKSNSIVLIILFLITAIALIVQYEITFGTFMILFALTFAVLQIHRFGEAKRKSDEIHNRGKEDIDI